MQHCNVQPSVWHADSSEQRECEQQLVMSVKQLTRQQLADMLLDRMQQHQQQQQPGGHITAAAVPLQLQHAQSSSHVQAPDIMPLHGAAQCMQYGAANCGNIVERSSSSSSGVEACTSSSSSLLQPDSWQQPEELREAMFQLVKAAAAAAQPGTTTNPSGLGYYQSMLLRWLKIDCSTTAVLKIATKKQQQGLSRSRNFSSGTASTAAAAAADIEASLLYAKLAVKCKQWAEAQRAAAAAEKGLQALVGP